MTDNELKAYDAYMAAAITGLISRMVSQHDVKPESIATTAHNVAKEALALRRDGASDFRA